jgi:hypothetical protein
MESKWRNRTIPRGEVCQNQSLVESRDYKHDQEHNNKKHAHRLGLVYSMVIGVTRTSLQVTLKNP